MAITLVQSASNTGIAGTSVTVTLGGAAAAGNCLVACIGELNGTTNPTVTGITLGASADNWALAKSAFNDADTNAEIWTDRSCAGGQTNVTVTFSAGTGGDPIYLVYVYEFSGVGTTAPLDKTNGTNAGSGTWSSGSTGTLSQASEVIVGVGAEGLSTGTVTMTGPGSPWTNLTQISNTHGTFRCSALSGYQVVSATTAQTYSGTSNGAFSGAAIITLKAAAGTSVALPVAQVTVTAPAPGIRSGPLALPAAQVVITAYPPLPGQVFPLPAAGVTVTALPPGIHRGWTVALSAAQVTVTARPPAPSVNVAVTLAAAHVSVTAHPVKVPRQLLIAIASQDGTDDYGNQYFAGVSSQLDGFISLLAQGAVYLGSAAQLFGTGVPGNLQGQVGLMSMNSGEESGTDTASGVVTESQSFSGITGGKIILSAGQITGALNIPQPTPAANSAAIIAALQAAGIFN